LLAALRRFSSWLRCDKPVFILAEAGKQMDLGVPYREITKMDVRALQAELLALSDEDWDRRPIRRASLSGGAHAVADCIVMRHEWIPAYSKRGFATLSDSLIDWAARNERPAEELLPILQEPNSETTVYTFRDWPIWQPKVLPLIMQVVGALYPEPKGVLLRALFVRLPGGQTVRTHVDQQEMATKTHRIHVCISDTPGCVYTSGDTEFSMVPGTAYDFNNVWLHKVENKDSKDRINLMLEYLPNPDWVAPAPIFVPRLDGSFV
jgi:hypothetical protein